MLTEWNDYQRKLKESVSQYADRLNDNQPNFSMKWDTVTEMGILSLPVAKEYKGLDQDIVTTMYVLEELGRVCEDAGFNFVVSSHMVSTEIPIQQFGSNTQKQRYLPGLCQGHLIGAHAITEPDNGSDAYNMNTTAVKKGDKYILNGSKMFITNAPIADLFIIYACTNKKKGALGGISAFIIEKSCPGFTTGKPIEKMGLKNAPFSELFFDNCEVSQDRLLRKEGLGFSIFNHVMKWEILCSFAINIGEMTRQLDRCIRYSKSAKTTKGPICKDQSLANLMVDMKINLEASRALLYKAGLKFRQGLNISIDLPIAKIVTSENYVKSSLNAIRVFEEYGYLRKYGIEKDLRNSLAGKIYSGSSEIQRNTIAALMGL